MRHFLIAVFFFGALVVGCNAEATGRFVKLQIDPDIYLSIDPEGDLFFIGTEAEYYREASDPRSLREVRRLDAQKRAQASLINLLIEYSSGGKSRYLKKVSGSIKLKNGMQRMRNDEELNLTEICETFEEMMDRFEALGLRGITRMLTTSKGNTIFVEYGLTKRSLGLD